MLVPFTREAQGDECHGHRAGEGNGAGTTPARSLHPCGLRAALPSLTLSPQTWVRFLLSAAWLRSLGDLFQEPHSGTPPKLLDLDPPQDRTDLLPSVLGRFRSWPELCQSGLPRGHFAQYTDGALGLPIAVGQVTSPFNRALWLRLPSLTEKKVGKEV